MTTALAGGVALAEEGPAGTALAPEGPAETPESAKATIHYKEGKELNFDQLIIEGQMKRPELSVVTGDDEQGANGLLKLREDFIDKMTVDASEQIP